MTSAGCRILLLIVPLFAAMHDGPIRGLQRASCFSCLGRFALLFNVCTLRFIWLLWPGRAGTCSGLTGQTQTE